ncbi:hypothetical protein EI94DRAFT_1737633 [Lactarius quietus]|nr:hypothetical protein EI94DRAFT_1737633 [Lactarius quietus]
MDFSTNSSSPARIPAFEARLNPQDGQDLSLGIPLEDNANIQYAAGGVRSSSLASTCPPSVPTSFDQLLALRALLSTCLSAEVNAGRDFGFPSDSPFKTRSQGSGLSSSSSSSPPSSMTSPAGEELLSSFASPDLSFHDLSMNDQDPMQAYQYPFDLSLLDNSQSYTTSPKQPFIQPLTLPEEFPTANVPVIADRSVGINNASAFPGSNSFLTVPPFTETTALGLYYPNTPQSFQIPSLSIQADASILSALPPTATAPAPPAEARKVRAAVPTVKTKRVRSGRINAVAAAAAASAAFGTNEDGVLKCPRHLRTHQDAKLTRYVCCGIPAAHPAAAGLDAGHSVRLYKGLEFVGGCGKSYARMDALQRHLGKSGCASGTAKDHQIWRQIYL